MRSLLRSRTVARLFGAALFLGTSFALANADVRYLYSAIDGIQEVPPVPTPATGTGIYVLDDVLSTLDFEVRYQGLFGAETMAHLHGPAPAGANAGILFALPFGTPKFGTLSVNTTQIGHLLSELVYVNIHSTSFGSGEIRGQLLVTGRGFCFGDGSGTPCPCGNPGGAHTGCANTTGAGGRLRPAGVPSATFADLSFVADGLIPNQPILLFRGANAVNSGNGVVFGDGLRCVGGNLVRVGVRIADAAGRAEWSPNLGVPPLIPGQVHRFQGWYRNPLGGGVCGSGFNLTNGVEIP